MGRGLNAVSALARLGVFMPLIAQITALADASNVTLRGVIGPYMGVFFVAFFVAFTLTPLLRWLAVRNGIIDWPDFKRKSHGHPVAYLGGVAVFMGWLVAVMLSYFTTPHVASLPAAMSFVNFPISVILGAGAIALTGLFDDVYGVSPRVKVGGQLFAAAALTLQETGLNLISYATEALGLPCPPEVAYVLGGLAITIFVIGGCNAMNLLDGLDGLATGIGVIATLGFLLIAGLTTIDHMTGGGPSAHQLHYDPVRLVMCLAVLGALLGFLPFNFNPATIFLGDTGSLLLGYLCIATILLFASEPNYAQTPLVGAPLKTVTACLIVFGVPIVDTTLAIFRRKLRGDPIMSPDKEHIHHLLRRSGMSVRQVVFVLYTMGVSFAGVGVTMILLDVRWRYMLAVVVVLFGFVAVTGVKYGQRLRQREVEANPVEAEPETEPHASPQPPSPKTAKANGKANGHPSVPTESSGSLDPPAR
jgi:UDP-GlcNAc:undecaprenyl-phosphate GlcNAc-1-phosphate transferase